MSASGPFTNGGLDRLMSNHFSKQLGNMSSSIPRSRLQLDLPIFLVHRRPLLGPSEGNDSAVVDVGISVSWTKSVSTYVSYNGLLGRDRYDSNGVSGGVRISF